MSEDEERIAADATAIQKALALKSGYADHIDGTIGEFSVSLDESTERNYLLTISIAVEHRS